jgi:glucokinase
MARAEDAAAGSIIGLDVGGSKVQIHVEAADGRLIRAQRRGPSNSPEELLALIEEVVADASSAGPVAAIGIGFPGLTDTLQGTVLSSVIIEGWTNVPLASLVADRLHIRCVVDNDVNNAARAEQAKRAEAGANMLFVSVGSGVGGALVLAGRLWSGVAGLAGEIGHVAVDRDGPRCLCGRIGCVGPRASGRAIAERLGITPAEAAKLALNGDAQAWSAIAETAGLLGRAIASVLNVLNLPLVVIGGGVAELGERYRALVEQSVRAEAFAEIAAASRIELAAAGYQAGAVGAALLAREHLKRRTGGATGWRMGTWAAW